MPKRRRMQKKVDYSMSGAERRRLTVYLGGFQRLSGDRALSANEKKRRLVFCSFGAALLFTGFLFVFI